MNAHEFYSAFVRTAQESTLVAKEMLPSFPEARGTATFLDLYRELLQLKKRKPTTDTFDYRGYLYNRQTRRFDRI